MDGYSVVLESFKAPLQELAAALKPEQLEQLQAGKVPLYASFGVDRLGVAWESKTKGQSRKALSHK